MISLESKEILAATPVSPASLCTVFFFGHIIVIVVWDAGLCQTIQNHLEMIWKALASEFDTVVNNLEFFFLN